MRSDSCHKQRKEVVGAPRFELETGCAQGKNRNVK
jgi:hypothetical protein